MIFYRIFKSRADRFTEMINAASVRLVTIKNIHFVLINSMAMEGDSCFLCRQAVNYINNISGTIKVNKIIIIKIKFRHLQVF